MKTKIKLRTCKNKACGDQFIRQRMSQTACCPGCAIIVGRDKLKADQAKAARADRVQTRKQLDAMKTIPELKAEAQTAFNAFIRERDRNQPCICCGGMPLTSGSLTGGSWDAAHYRSRGSADHLRYNENNVHRSLKNCNTYGHEDYRGGLIKRIGIEAVEALECDQAIVKWNADMLRGIKAMYQAKLKALLANKEMGM